MSQAKELEFSLTQADFETAGRASSMIKQVLEQAGVQPDVIRRVVIASYEAAMNVVVHAYRGIMKASVFADRTELLVRDDGPGIADINLAMRPGYSTAPDHARAAGFGAGTGLSTIASYPDKCTIDSVVGTGTTIHLVIRH